MEFEVKTGAVAKPLEFVVTVAVFPVPGAANVPLAPVAGAVNVTDAPLTGLPPLSVTLACKFVGNAVLMAMLCGVPALVTIAAAGPGLLVSENDAGVATPVTVAFTV